MTRRITLILVLALAAPELSGCKRSSPPPPPATTTDTADTAETVPETTEPPRTGACCIGFRCHILTEAQCTDSYGEYFGDDTTCEGRSCAGACCMADGSCEDVPTQGVCELNTGGHWQGAGTTCADVQCPQPKRRPITPNAERRPITPNNPDRPR